jgi:hypothetical protein
MMSKKLRNPYIAAFGWAVPFLTDVIEFFCGNTCDTWWKRILRLVFMIPFILFMVIWIVIMVVFTAVWATPNYVMTGRNIADDAGDFFNTPREDFIDE